MANKTIKFKEDYPIFTTPHKAGEVIDVLVTHADKLIEQGVAEEVVKEEDGDAPAEEE